MISGTAFAIAFETRRAAQPKHGHELASVLRPMHFSGRRRCSSLEDPGCAGVERGVQNTEVLPEALRCAVRAPLKPGVTFLGQPSNACVRPRDGLAAAGEPGAGQPAARAMPTQPGLLLHQSAPIASSEYMSTSAVQYHFLCGELQNEVRINFRSRFTSASGSHRFAA